MAENFRAPLHVPLVFDAERAQRILDEIRDASPQLVADEATHALIAAAAGNSAYLANGIVREHAFVTDLFEHGPDASLAALCTEALSVESEPEMETAMRVLRVARRRVALVVALADIGGLYDLSQVTAALTRFADASVKGALRFLLRQAAARTGMPETSGEKLEASSGLIVLAMGKMGAFELNFSSDIDLIVFFDAERFPYERAGDKQTAAVDIAKGIVKLLAETTAESYVFRVDLRLRPDAGATQIAISTESAELYYESMGQNWERAAMIKARVCAGDTEAGARFLKTLQPYIWRKYLDYAAIEDIHSIKRQIHAHGGHARVAVAGHNLKLGRGGIREIEFFAQTQQLILGGRDVSLREPSTLGALRALTARGHITPAAERDLASAYRFLRTLEHRLQMIDDQQTHTLPKDADGLDHIARFSGYADTRAFEDAVRSTLTSVESHYARLFEREAPLTARAGSLVFTGVEEDPETVATLARMGFARAADISATIRGWHHGRIGATRSTRSRELLTKLMPALLEALSKTADPDAAFTHFDRFLTRLPAGVQVFSLLLANPHLLDLIAEIAGSAPRLAEYLGRNAGVLDALIDPEFLGRIPEPQALRARCVADLTRAGSFEEALDEARRFAREENFRIGVQVIQGLAQADEAGPAYAAVAEAVIAGLNDVVARDMEAVHGSVLGGEFVVIALGKLGGCEMTATSDLDLVFIYRHDPNASQSDGTRPLAPSSYFARASQRLISALTAATAEGRLYDVDMRLRPSGNQGPVAVRLDTFVEYQKSEAWTWERMALTRARVLAGPPAFRAEVEAAIRAALTRSHDPQAIAADARTMREKLAAQFPGRDPWDIKFAPGGLVDVEFIAQVLQLQLAPRDPAVLHQNTVASLRKLGRAGALAPEDAEALIGAARLEHSLTHVLRIALEGPFQPKDAARGLKALLARAGDAPDFPSLERQLKETESTVRAIFEKLVHSAGKSTSAPGDQER